ncbi:hypothetical protein [Clostridium novyi]|uniref:hypothetical protein n=1 Tax=Clostridium novyi TaxID=1542 RepID=UPI0004D50899|nr:hypothetical protein [Clostridium novyi]KEI12624.1 hypothetical protein Z958_06035 [Clostridium novyi B str. NCTC 9691]
MLSIDFNNYNSYRDFGLVMEHIPSIPTAEKETKTINIEGVEESIVEEKQDTYKDIKINIPFGFKNNDPGIDRVIKNWIINFTNNKLTLSNDSGVFYKVKKTKMSDIVTKIRSIKRFEVQFELSPLAYYYKGLETVVATSPIILYSPEAATNSIPVINLYGNGDITLNINNEQLYFRNIKEKITINSILQECYKDNKNCNDNMKGKFPKLVPGGNNISWSGSVDRIEITPNWRTV